MGLGITLTGSYGGSGLFNRQATPEAFLEQAARWARAECGETLADLAIDRNHSGQPTLYLFLHPTAEAVEITAPARGRLFAGGKTSTTGPGYHAYVCDLLRRLERDLRLRWDPPAGEDDDGSCDETGYYETGDRAALEEAMLGWLRGMARVTLDNMPEGTTGWQLAMAMEHEYEHDGLAATPLGPRDRAWFEAAAEDSARGKDFFAWWEHGPGAPYRLGRALALMWTQVRWRPPLDEQERDLLLGVTGLLESAHRQDHSLPYPWREWAELLGYLETETPLAVDVARRAREVEGPLIGYRRRPVTADLAGGWSIRVPGSLKEAPEPEAWIAWDNERVVRVALWHQPGTDFQAAGEHVLAQTNSSEPPLEWREGALTGRAVVEQVTVDGHTHPTLIGYAALPGRGALCTLTFNRAEDRDWAIETWHSLRHSSQREGA